MTCARRAWPKAVLKRGAGMATKDVAALKREAAQAALELVEPGMALGLGSGSTALAFVEALAERIAAGLTVGVCVVTSRGTGAAAVKGGIEVVDMMRDDAPTRLDLVVDGADEVDPALRLIKGGGAARLREKVVAQMADRVVGIADGAKRVAQLGAFPLPVEIIPYGRAVTLSRLADAAGVNPVLRTRAGGDLVQTDNGNLVADLSMGAIDDPDALSARLTAIPGVVEHGLFLHEADGAIIAGDDGISRLNA